MSDNVWYFGLPILAAAFGVAAAVVPLWVVLVGILTAMTLWYRLIPIRLWHGGER